MHYRRLGRSGLKVSEISLGAWVTFGTQVDQKLASELIHTAYEAGINYFDNADAYGNGQAELLMGEAIRDLPREGLVVSSKVFWPTMPGPNGGGLSRKHILESAHASLKRFGTDYLDLYFCHRFDPDTPVDEVARAMDDLVHQGKVLYWGTSEWRAWQISSAFNAAESHHLVPPAIEQPQYNMFHRERVETELASLCKDLGIGLVTFSPLYYGILTGKYNDGIPQGTRAALADYGWVRDRITPERVAVVRKLGEVARDLSLSTAQLAIAWILRRKEVSSVITGATRLEQLDENLETAEAEHQLTEEILEMIEEIVGNISESE
jgi:voltage-dependent potassium channel beta subunit